MSIYLEDLEGMDLEEIKGYLEENGLDIDDIDGLEDIIGDLDDSPLAFLKHRSYESFLDESGLSDDDIVDSDDYCQLEDDGLI